MSSYTPRTCDRALIDSGVCHAASVSPCPCGWAPTPRDAAVLMRQDVDARWHAVADWLDLESKAPTRCENCTVSHHPDFHRMRAAAVARAYVGGMP